MSGVEAPRQQQSAETRPTAHVQRTLGQEHEQADGGAQHSDTDHKPIPGERLREMPTFGTNQQQQLAATADGLHPEDIKPAAQESLKSTLIAIASSSDAPPALREAAQQLVQHITGQQLMLTPERNGAVFSHLTMFVPLNGPDGNQTASVHIQTRRGRQGQLDASNCRLLFDLSMRSLGPTLVDVNVMDKIVSLTLWNDHPAISALIDSSRSEIAVSLNQAGYQLLSLRTTPTRSVSEEGEEIRQAVPDPAQFVKTRYKGVDLRA
ncbi:hypothetical protein MU1_28080 [Paenibacillus glycanilyticus]|uniref:Flagellar hook-length control protein FliK n=1 Tax=Paenibacillus glycanilyticus TaxID=126569 RepID=A0ABQ6GGJ8_9BACL|nr:hypothetical protein MU1_28080 [Paenibacillus glycanilyticus]